MIRSASAFFCLAVLFGFSTEGFAQTYRQKLTSAGIFFVNADKNNPSVCNNGQSLCGAGNDGVTAAQALSTSTPFATLTQAISVAVNTYDFSGQPPIFDLAHGTSPAYGGVAFGNGLVGATAMKVRGDSTAPTAVGLVANSTAAAIWMTHYIVMHLENLAIVDGGGAVYGVVADGWAGLDLGNVTCQSFNPAAFCVRLSNYSHLECEYPNNNLPGLIVGGDMGGLVDLQNSFWNCGPSGPNLPPGFGTVSIPNPVTFAVAGVRSKGNGLLQNFNANTFVGAGVAGTMGPRAILQGPGYMTTSPAESATCDHIFKWNGAPCQLTQGFHDDAGE
jgi:hypothetical protein